MYHQLQMTRLGETRAACALELSRSERRQWADRMLGECFDPEGELLISAHCRPHWSQAGAVVFVTFRLHDSIPREVLTRWDREKQEWLRQHGHDTSIHWASVVPTLVESERAAFFRKFDRCREEFLDSCHGSCLLRRPDLAAIVSEVLLHFDGTRYRMGDFVVMPNHVHLMAIFPTAEAMKAACASWLHYSAFRINQAVGAKAASGSLNHLIIWCEVRNSTPTCDSTSPTIRVRPA